MLKIAPLVHFAELASDLGLRQDLIPPVLLFWEVIGRVLLSKRGARETQNQGGVLSRWLRRTLDWEWGSCL